MLKSIMNAVVILGLTACTNASNQNTETSKTASSEIKTQVKMNNLVSIIEIPINDYAKASAFYQSILNVKIDEVDMGDVKMGVIPNDEGTVNVVLAKGADYKPSQNGATIYLNAGEDLQPMLDKVEKSGGKIIVPKTEISPEMGYFALFFDTEGNKIGLHSAK